MYNHKVLCVFRIKMMIVIKTKYIYKLQFIKVQNKLSFKHNNFNKIFLYKKEDETALKGNK